MRYLFITLLLFMSWHAVNGQNWETFQEKHLAQNPRNVPRRRGDCERSIHPNWRRRPRNSLIFTTRDAIRRDFEGMGDSTHRRDFRVSRNGRVICSVEKRNNQVVLEILCRDSRYTVTLEGGLPNHFETHNRNNCEDLLNGQQSPVMFNIQSEILKYTAKTSHDSSTSTSFDGATNNTNYFDYSAANSSFSNSLEAPPSVERS